MQDIFFKSSSEYNEKLDILKSYLEQLTQYIKVKKGCSKDKAYEIAKDIFKKNYQAKNIKFFHRPDLEDREVRNMSLLEYVQDNISQGNILAPTLTAYINSNVKRSIVSEFITVNIKDRSIAKKAAQAAKAEGDIETFLAKNSEQANKKIYANAVSGLFGLKSFVLYNPTAHSTLTSVTRTATSVTNVSNERLVAGNRYLPRQQDVLRSIVYESTYINECKVKEAVDTYNLHLPSPEEVVSILKYSSDLYFKDSLYYERKVLPYLKKLSPYQLAGIAYSGDLFHLRKYNDGFTRTFFDKLTYKVKPDGSRLEDPSVLYKFPEGILYYGHAIFSEELRGVGKDYVKLNNTDIAKALYSTCLNIQKVLEEYKLYFNAFFMTDLTVINAHRPRHMRRRTVVLSDTDSSAYCMDEWVIWREGSFVINSRSVALAGAITFLVTSNLVHQLATISMNMNIPNDYISTIAFKNEYLWSSFATASVSKHYYSLTMIVEGNVYEKPEIEIKGVHLKNSAVSRDTIEKGFSLMENIQNSIFTNNKLKLSSIIQNVIDTENEIITTVQAGEGKYFKKSKIKDETAYALDRTKSPYLRHTFWNEVFGPKYGLWEEPPYDTLKVPTTITTKTDLTNWLSSIGDEVLRTRLSNWLVMNNKPTLPTVYLRTDYVLNKGVPVELLPIINIEKVVLDCTLQQRIILGTLGLQLTENLLVKDQLSPVITKEEPVRRKEVIWKGNGYKGPGYIVNSKGDSRFSPYVATLSNGYSLEAIYQGLVKGYGLENWKEGKGKPSLREVDLWSNYLKIWKIWARENPERIEELRLLAWENEGILVDFFATTENNQARALAEILNNGYN